MITSDSTAEVATLEKAKGELQEMSAAIDREVISVARAFEGLAGHTDSILKVTAAIVGCVEDENISSVLPKVQALGEATKRSIGERLQATIRILDAVAIGVKLLRQLSVLTVGQEAIALETKALSVLTNVEAARLGAVGAGFQFLARELADFSKTLMEDTQEVATQTEERRASIEGTRNVLSAELPALREKLARVEGDLGKELTMLESRLTQLSSTPVRFKASVEHTRQQIDGVVAAVQAHDITRQQIEHVVEALTLIASSMDAAGESGLGADRERSSAHAGITIQVYQLKTIAETVQGWTSQVKTCMRGILSVSATEVVGIGPLVLQQEHEVSSQLSHIEMLERESQSYGKRIQGTLRGLSTLMQLVNEHRKKSKAARDRLRLLSFNSIIEARRLGAEAGAILAIARSIKEISAAWIEIAEQSGKVMEEIQSLEIQTSEVMEVFSEASNEFLREAQARTVDGLSSLRNAAAFAEARAKEMDGITEKIQIKGANVGDISGRLETCFGHVDALVAHLESVRRLLEIRQPHIAQKYDLEEIEKLFSVSYTTEMERQVMRAALHGSALRPPNKRLEETVSNYFEVECGARKAFPLLVGPRGARP